MVEVNVSLRPLAGGVVALDLRGFVDKHTVHVLDQSIARMLEQGRNRLIVNCRELGYISSDGMGVFLSHLIKIRKSGGDIKFCTMSREARTVVGVLGLGNLLEVHETEEQALAEFERRRREREARERAKEDDQKLAIERVVFEPDISVLRLRGFIDRHTIDTLEAALKRALDEGRAKIVVDCAGLTYISSNGMGIFIAYVQKARAKGGDIRFSSMRDVARTVITMLGLQNIFKVHPNEAEALASYGAGAGAGGAG
jgi:anti-sigma B factor antagonist